MKKISRNFDIQKENLVFSSDDDFYSEIKICKRCNFEFDLGTYFYCPICSPIKRVSYEQLLVAFANSNHKGIAESARKLVEGELQERERKDSILRSTNTNSGN
jgi:late competence protein required for DNA uptake (superfamily II DNA/RNA helicase)